MKLLYLPLRLIHNLATFLKLLGRVRLHLSSSDVLYVSIDKGVFELTLNLTTGELKLKSENDVSINGRYMFIQCDSERVEAIQEGLHLPEVASKK